MSFTFTDAEVLSDTQLVAKIFQEAEFEIIQAIRGKNLWRDSDRVQMLRQIKSILTELEKETVLIVNPIVEKYYESGAKEVDEAVGKSGLFQLIDKTAVQFIVASLSEIKSEYQSEVRNMLSNAYTNIEKTLNQVKRELRTELTSQIATAQITGKSKTALSKNLIEKLENNGITGFVIPSENTKSGIINLSTKAYIKGLTQSTFISSRASSTIQRALELGQDLLKISTHSKPSPMCEKWAGKIVSITGQTFGYPSLQEALFTGNYKKGGIFHRYCRHSLNVYIPTDIQFKSKSSPK